MIFCLFHLKFFVFLFSAFFAVFQIIINLSWWFWCSVEHNDKNIMRNALMKRDFMTSKILQALQLLNRKYQKYRLYIANNIKTHVQHILNTFVLCVFLLLMLIDLCWFVKRNSRCDFTFLVYDKSSVIWCIFCFIVINAVTFLSTNSTNSSTLP